MFETATPRSLGAKAENIKSRGKEAGKNRVPQIFIVADDTEVCETLSEYLGLHGYQVSTFATLAPARRALAGREPAPCLLLLDTDTVTRDCLLSFDSLIADGLTAVILISGGGTQVDHILGIGLPLHAHVMKPLDLRELLAKTKQVFDCLISNQSK